MKIVLIARDIKISPIDRLEVLSCEDLLRVEIDLHEKRSLLKETIRQMSVDYSEIFDEVARERCEDE